MYIGTTYRGLTEEIQIPMPWGYVAAKTWGSPSNYPVLCIHGWLDNANTFDTLIPLLPKGFFYVCIDLPGHGLSSFLPPGMLYLRYTYSSVIYKIVQYFKWKICSIMGHSLGGAIATKFSYTFPDHIDKLILLDSMGFWMLNPQDIKVDSKRNIQEHFSIENKITKSNKISKELAAKKLLTSNLDISKDQADIILERGMTQHDNGLFTFNRDPKQKFVFDVLHNHYRAIPYLISTDKAEVLQLISAYGSHMRDNKTYGQQFHPDYYRSLKKYYKHEVIDGNHYVHLSEPEKVAGHITDMLKRPPRKDIKFFGSKL